jgi:ABC-type transporter Mla subunit MlaD
VGLRETQDQVGAVIRQASDLIKNAETAVDGLSQQHASFDQLVKSLPDAIKVILAEAEKRIVDQQVAMASLVADMPARIERVVEQKLIALMSQSETRISDRLRDELKDTRMALRDAMEVNSRTQETKLESAVKDIIAEMPRGLFGRRGRD